MSEDKVTWSYETELRNGDSDRYARVMSCKEICEENKEKNIVKFMLKFIPIYMKWMRMTVMIINLYL